MNQFTKILEHEAFLNLVGKYHRTQNRDRHVLRDEVIESIRFDPYRIDALIAWLTGSNLAGRLDDAIDVLSACEKELIDYIDNADWIDDRTYILLKAVENCFDKAR